jgi:ABC-2 type transport system ATP-binding protein
MNNPSSQYAINIQNLIKVYRNGKGEVRALNDLNLQIRTGELYGLLGPNGAGKTTMINILCGLNSATSGSATVGGFDVSKELDRIKQIIGVCPQEPALFPYLSGRQNLQLFGDLHTVPKKELHQRIHDLLEKIGLLGDANRPVRTYSGGMIRRINTLIALVNDPVIIFLDEPTVAMDPQSRHAVWDFIKELKVRGKTVILTTHYIEEADVLCDRIGIIDQGTLIAEGTPGELKLKYNAKTLEEVFIQLTGRRIREEN